MAGRSPRAGRLAALGRFAGGTRGGRSVRTFSFGAVSPWRAAAPAFLLLPLTMRCE
jgi:hypothetical protein